MLLLYYTIIQSYAAIRLQAFYRGFMRGSKYRAAEIKRLQPEINRAQRRRSFPFAIYYRVDGEVATVVAVLDARRSPQWIRKRLV